LSSIVAAHKTGDPVGVYSICSAHPFVLEASVQQAREDGSPWLVESTCNQVNQEGGYTGMRPSGFRDYVHRIADRFAFPRRRLILGGDHLGPHPWEREPAESAMAKAQRLVRDCVLAGYAKFHLDASTRCADDPTDAPLTKAVSAERAAELCLAAEEACRGSRSDQKPLLYVIGTEVPPPGGARPGEDRPMVTTVKDARETIELTREAFKSRGLDAAWKRVVALVVQPGVEFSDDSLFNYERQAASQLSQFIEPYDHLVFEAHSTDYQPRHALRAMVEDHFAILKVGPAATFAFREAVFALAMMEAEWLSKCKVIRLSNVQRVLDAAMLHEPAHWKRYYARSEPYAQFARKYSFSDRSRYYWPDPDVQEALSRLLHNLEAYPVPLTLLSQFLPEQYQRVRAGMLQNSPVDLIHDKIRSVLADYAYACGCRDQLHRQMRPDKTSSQAEAPRRGMREGIGNG
jgi:D-tagatose-1,6-bisphosphate aldolase subunit GatZ/KbaZ